MRYNIITLLIIGIMLFACNTHKENSERKTEDFEYVLEQFADLRILRYKVPGFEDLNLKQKKLIYYLSQAAVSGRDILFDQNGKYNLLIRRTLENIYTTFNGDKSSKEWQEFVVYLKRIWFSNGIYHHYSSDKFIPGFNKEYFNNLITFSAKNNFPKMEGKTIDETLEIVSEVIFNPDFASKKILQASGVDMVKGSAVNFYAEELTQQEVEEFYNSLRDESDTTPVSYGLNSRVVKDNNKLKEVVWKIDGLYGGAIKEIVYWLSKAVDVAETTEQKNGLEKLIEYYNTGDLNIWDEYNVIWVKDLASHIDFINGFVEVYSDPLGMKGTWESIVNFKDIEATKRTKIISDNAQWFEDNSPIDNRFKKKEVKGVSAKVITVAMLGGDCYPHTPIGINLPNADWIRKMHGSKSVTIENVTYAYSQANLTSGFLEEFSVSKEDMELEKKYGPLSDNLHTDLHECLGHGSGQLLPGVKSEALKNYHSPLEETRADLFALYYMMDTKMVDLGLIPSLDVAKAHYISYIRNGLMTQLRRIEPGKSIEQAHMRNRQLISKWCYEKGQADNVIEKVIIDGKTFFKINDYEKLRALFGDLLVEAQRIKSEGDYEAGKELVESYGIKFDPELHKEVLERFEKLNIAAYSGFVNPEYDLIETNGKITDIKVRYVDDFSEQMLKYSKKYSFLPDYNY